MTGVRVLSALLVFCVGVILAACSSAVPGAAVAVSTSAPATTTSSAGADRKVCVDLDARGGALYTVFVVPMMKGPSGAKSVDVSIAQIVRATSSVAGLDPVSLTHASAPIADEAERLVAAAKAFQAYDHAEGTALLTSFVGLAVECQKAGFKPSWFDAATLAR
ncbi:MAG: hypothetical protein EKK42_25235 [Pseudonocardiaceae bacterium]|nr:MAG: hypothetical protein EKK42_25235 [Pseudonocardiaceae bacterium]